MYNWHSQKVPVEAPELHGIISARKPCVADVLCNWKSDSQTIKWETDFLYSACTDTLKGFTAESSSAAPVV